MKNWVIQGLRYDYYPTPYNYIKSRWSHFHFCKMEDPTITAVLYLDNLASELNHEISKQKSVNKNPCHYPLLKKFSKTKKQNKN